MVRTLADRAEPLGTFYELETNILYFTKSASWSIRPTTSDALLLPEYGVRRFIARYEEVKKKGREAFLRPKSHAGASRGARASLPGGGGDRHRSTDPQRLGLPERPDQVLFVAT